MNLIKYIGSQFAKPTGISGKTTTFIMNRMNQQQYNTVMTEIFKYPKTSKILDVGFGNGYMLQKLAHQGYSLYGIDISNDMVELAAKKIKNNDVVLKCESLEDISFESGTFDIVYTINTIYFWPNLRAGLEQIYRVLKTDGVFINALYTKAWLDKNKFTKYDYKKYYSGEIEETAYSLGFKDISIRESKKDKSLVMTMRK